MSKLSEAMRAAIHAIPVYASDGTRIDCDVLWALATRVEHLEVDAARIAARFRGSERAIIDTLVERDRQDVQWA